jgi:dTDP-4-amino-4,6-dideoxygalactose transaminase
MLGYNMRMMDLTAAIGLVQLMKLKEWNSIRRENAAYLTSGLSKISGVVVPKIRYNSEHVFHQYTIRIADRDNAARKLKEKGVGVGIHYPIPIHKQPFYSELGYSDSLPVAEAASQEVLSLPVHPSLSKADLDSIVQAVASL